MTTIPAAASRATPGGLAPDPRTGSTAPPPAAKTAKTAMPAVVLDLSASAKTALGSRPARTTTGPAAPNESVSRTFTVRSFDEIVGERTGKLASALSTALKAVGVPIDEPIDLKLDTFGKVRTDSPYKAKIEKLFEDDPELAKEFKDVAGLNAMRAAQKALEAFDTERKAARNEAEQDAAYALYMTRSATAQDLSGTMTLEDGKLRSWSLEFMARSTGETPTVAPREPARQTTAPGPRKGFDQRI